jgi:transposase
MGASFARFLVAGHELCRRFMQIPGVGPIAELGFMTAIDDPSRFKRSRDVAAYFGLTSRRWQSGNSIDVQGRISKAADSDVRRALYEAASALLTRFKRKDKVKSCGLASKKRAGHRKATVPVVRKLAVIMHAMWLDGTCYLWRSRRIPRRCERSRVRQGSQAAQGLRMRQTAVCKSMPR